MRYVLFCMVLLFAVVGMAVSHPYKGGMILPNTLLQQKDTLPACYPDSFFNKISGKEALIIPGKSIGVFKVNVQTKRFYKNLAKKVTLPKRQKGGVIMTGSTYGAQWYYWNGTTTKYVFAEGSKVTFNQKKKDTGPSVIQMLRTTDPRFQTKEGLGVGSSFAEITKAFNKLKRSFVYESYPGKEHIALYSSAPKGIVFEMASHNN